jgi:hypothetical protein
MAISVVGSVTGVGAGATITVSLTSLTILEGDLILVLSGWAGTTDGNPGVTSPAGFTELADLYANLDHDANMSVAYLIAGASPPTSITVTASGNTNNGSTAIVVVFRGVDPITPFSATITTATGTGSTAINSPAITPLVANSWILSMGLTAGVNGQTFTPPAGYTEIVERNSGSTRTRESSAVVAYLANPTRGTSQDPAAFTASGTGATASWAAATMSLRMKGGKIKVWNGSSWVVKPVKFYNGSTWIEGMTKRWNGSAWVPTNY